MKVNKLEDKYGRTVDYVRLSVTDRCDLRCTYCMHEKMVFLPHKQILSLDEIYFVARAFTELGVKKIRLTGGEPLVRRNVLALVRRIGALPDLRQLAITTNATRLADYAAALKAAGVKRLNISLDSLNPLRFHKITRVGKLDKVLQGIDAALALGFPSIRLNTVVQKGINEDEILSLVAFARVKKIDIAFIEEMPLGDTGKADRMASFLSNSTIRQRIEKMYPLQATDKNTQGPARYYGMADSDSQVGFISPHSHNFCSTCNRVRVTVEGKLLLCLGNDHAVDLKPVIRQYPGDMQRLQDTLIEAMDIKPERHHFALDDQPKILRFMNMTGG